MGYGNYLLELLYPPRCSMCGELTDPDKRKHCFCERCRAVWEQEKNELCPDCRRDALHCVCLPKFNKARTADSYRSLVLYDSDNIKHVIYRIKTERDAALYDLMARELSVAVMRYCAIDGNSLLAYPQRSRGSVRKYGMDHAKILCRAVSKYTGLPVFEGLRHRKGAEQKTLPASMRGENAANSYYVPDKQANDLRGKNIIFIDDVVTTGATSVVCAALCKANGARSFSVFSIARTP